jgi:hypothetical protein
MKSQLVSIFFIAVLPLPLPEQATHLKVPNPSGNLFIISIDGFRWQEVFTGADSALIHDETFTAGAAILKTLYWDTSPELRRKKLMPFFWNVLAANGQVYGNRHYDNKMNVANAYAISYPGYNEMLTGNTDPFISSNRKYKNPNVNVLEYLNGKAEFNGRVAVFTSWDVFPYILNKKRNSLLINSGYEKILEQEQLPVLNMLNKVQQEVVKDKKTTRYDQLTFIAAKEYLQQHRPGVFYLALGETDEFAHDGRYDLYLQQANTADKMIAELWYWVQTTDGYKNNTTFIITTDHGRGRKKNTWSSHGLLTGGSSEVWLAVAGPGISPLGEMKEKQQLFLKQVAQTIANLFGEEFDPGHQVAAALPIRISEKSPSVDGDFILTTAGK